MKSGKHTSPGQFKSTPINMLLGSAAATKQSASGNAMAKAATTQTFPKISSVTEQQQAAIDAKTKELQEILGLQNATAEGEQKDRDAFNGNLKNLVTQALYPNDPIEQSFIDETAAQAATLRSQTRNDKPAIDENKLKGVYLKLTGVLQNLLTQVRAIEENAEAVATKTVESLRLDQRYVKVLVNLIVKRKRRTMTDLQMPNIAPLNWKGLDELLQEAESSDPAGKALSELQEIVVKRRRRRIPPPDTPEGTVNPSSTAAENFYTRFIERLRELAISGVKVTLPPVEIIEAANESLDSSPENTESTLNAIAKKLFDGQGQPASENTEIGDAVVRLIALQPNPPQTTEEWTEKLNNLKKVLYATGNNEQRVAIKTSINVMRNNNPDSFTNLTPEHLELLIAALESKVIINETKSTATMNVNTESGSLGSKKTPVNMLFGSAASTKQTGFGTAMAKAPTKKSFDAIPSIVDTAVDQILQILDLKNIADENLVQLKNDLKTLVATIQGGDAPNGNLLDSIVSNVVTLRSQARNGQPVTSKNKLNDSYPQLAGVLQNLLTQVRNIEEKEQSTAKPDIDDQSNSQKSSNAKDAPPLVQPKKGSVTAQTLSSKLTELEEPTDEEILLAELKNHYTNYMGNLASLGEKLRRLLTMRQTPNANSPAQALSDQGMLEIIGTPDFNWPSVNELQNLDGKLAQEARVQEQAETRRKRRQISEVDDPWEGIIVQLKLDENLLQSANQYLITLTDDEEKTLAEVANLIDQNDTQQEDLGDAILQFITLIKLSKDQNLTTWQWEYYFKNLKNILSAKENTEQQEWIRKIIKFITKRRRRKSPEADDSPGSSELTALQLDAEVLAWLQAAIEGKRLIVTMEIGQQKATKTTGKGSFGKLEKQTVKLPLLPPLTPRQRLLEKMEAHYKNSLEGPVIRLKIYLCAQDAARTGSPTSTPSDEEVLKSISQGNFQYPNLDTLKNILGNLSAASETLYELKLIDQSLSTTPSYINNGIISPEAAIVGLTINNKKQLTPVETLQDLLPLLPDKSSNAAAKNLREKIQNAIAEEQARINELSTNLLALGIDEEEAKTISELRIKSKETKSKPKELASQLKKLNDNLKSDKLDTVAQGLTELSDFTPAVTENGKPSRFVPTELKVSDPRKKLAAVNQKIKRIAELSLEVAKKSTEKKPTPKQLIAAILKAYAEEAPRVVETGTITSDPWDDDAVRKKVLEKLLREVEEEDENAASTASSWITLSDASVSNYDLPLPPATIKDEVSDSDTKSEDGWIDGEPDEQPDSLLPASPLHDQTTTPESDWPQADDPLKKRAHVVREPKAETPARPETVLNNKLQRQTSADNASMLPTPNKIRKKKAKQAYKMLTPPEILKGIQNFDWYANNKKLLDDYLSNELDQKKEINVQQNFLQSNLSPPTSIQDFIDFLDAVARSQQTLDQLANTEDFNNQKNPSRSKAQDDATEIIHAQVDAKVKVPNTTPLPGIPVATQTSSKTPTGRAL